MENAPQPIVIKRIVAGHGHHGGGWKVAFADFATAMMAFFLLMWLMGSTTAEQRGGISEYFQNPSIAQGASPTPSPSVVQGAGGASTSLLDLGGATEQYKDPAPPKQEADLDLTEKALQQAEAQLLTNLKSELEQAIDLEPLLKPFKDQIIMDLTPEGLRIQIVDKENRSMFDVGGATLKDYSLTVLLELAKAINTVPNKISISGHTDPSKYIRQNYSNWELSTDRANSARRALIVGGLPEEKMGRVVGLSSTALLDAENPQNPINRRISIIVMNARTEAAIKQESAATRGDQDTAITADDVVVPAAAAATDVPAVAGTATTAAATSPPAPAISIGPNIASTGIAISTAANTAKPK